MRLSKYQDKEVDDGYFRGNQKEEERKSILG